MFKHIVERFIAKKAKDRNKEIVLIGACIKPMTDEYRLCEDAEQAIEYAFHWYEKTDRSHALPIKNGGYFPITASNIVESMEFSQHVNHLVKKHALPIVFSNSCESLTECLANIDRGRVGVININHRMDLVNNISFIPMQAYASILNKNSTISLLSIGVFEEYHTASELELAESMGVEHLNSPSFYSASPFELDRDLELFIAKNEAITINIDLRTIVRGMTTQPPYAIDFGLVLSVMNLCMQSGKVRLIQMTGDNEALIFSKEVKSVLDVIRTKI
jgi:hypothetical protein